MATELAQELRAHLAEGFPSAVEKGIQYGEVEPVMIAADIYGWAKRVSQGEALSGIDRGRLRDAADELERSLSAFPADSRPYFTRILRIAKLAL